MPELLGDLVHLPVGSHCVGFHVGRTEAADHAASFLAGTPAGQAASYWVADLPSQEIVRNRVATESPGHVGCVAVLSGEQVALVDGKLRPIDEILEFVGSHPEGVTAGGETIDRHWTPTDLPQHLEYEAWFQEQRRDGSRFLCPYDLRRVPAESAPQVLAELGAHHSHVVLSDSPEPAVRLLQLFVFGRAPDVPPALHETLGWAVSWGLVDVEARSRELSLARGGEDMVKEWGRTATIDW